LLRPAASFEVVSGGKRHNLASSTFATFHQSQRRSIPGAISRFRPRRGFVRTFQLDSRSFVSAQAGSAPAPSGPERSVGTKRPSISPGRGRFDHASGTVPLTFEDLFVGCPARSRLPASPDAALLLASAPAAAPRSFTLVALAVHPFPCSFSTFSPPPCPIEFDSTAHLTSHGRHNNSSGTSSGRGCTGGDCQAEHRAPFPLLPHLASAHLRPSGPLQLSPILVACFLSVLICGLVLSLSASYFDRFGTKDRWLWLVVFLTAIAVGDTMNNTSWIYESLCHHWGEVAYAVAWRPQLYVAFFVFFSLSPRPTRTDDLLVRSYSTGYLWYTGLVVGIVQSWFVWRVWVVSGGKAKILTGAAALATLGGAAWYVSLSHLVYDPSCSRCPSSASRRRSLLFSLSNSTATTF
jgi:hypothetical protein